MLKRLQVLTFRTAADARVVVAVSRRYQSTRFFRVGRWVWWFE